MMRKQRKMRNVENWREVRRGERGLWAEWSIGFIPLWSSSLLLALPARPLVRAEDTVKPSTGLTHSQRKSRADEKRARDGEQEWNSEQLYAKVFAGIAHSSIAAWKPWERFSALSGLCVGWMRRPRSSGVSFMLYKWLSVLVDGQVVEMKWTVLIFQPEICLLIRIGHIFKARLYLKACGCALPFILSLSPSQTPLLSIPQRTFCPLGRCDALSCLCNWLFRSLSMTSREQPDKSPWSFFLFPISG